MYHCTIKDQRNVVCGDFGAHTVAQMQNIASGMVVRYVQDNLPALYKSAKVKAGSFKTKRPGLQEVTVKTLVVNTMQTKFDTFFIQYEK